MGVGGMPGVGVGMGNPLDPQQAAIQQQMAAAAAAAAAAGMVPVGQGGQPHPGTLGMEVSLHVSWSRGRTDARALL